MTARILVALALAGGSACAIVPQNRRGHLADPMMELAGDEMQARHHQKVYGAREAAAGGDGFPAGGGCGCQ